jgi:hypothetical protein
VASHPVPYLHMYARDGRGLYVVPGQPDRTAAANSDPEAVAAGLRHYLARYPDRSQH